jgi:hypothetical protein
MYTFLLDIGERARQANALLMAILPRLPPNAGRYPLVVRSPAATHYPQGAAGTRTSSLVVERRGAGRAVRAVGQRDPAWWQGRGAAARYATPSPLIRRNVRALCPRLPGAPRAAAQMALRFS